MNLSRDGEPLVILRVVVDSLRARTWGVILTPLHLARSRFSRRPLTGGAPVDVCLTTYGARARWVHLTIESIARGSVRPRRVVLWVTAEDRLLLNVRALRRLVVRGLEVEVCDDLGPHKKYLPYVETAGSGQVALVTADDDVYYDRAWLSDLVRAASAHPGEVHCHRSRVAWFGAGALAPYGTWLPNRSTRASAVHVPIGVGGVLYPVEVQVALRRRGRAALDIAPRQDDLWLHMTAVTEGHDVRQVRRTARHPALVPMTARRGLMGGNLGGSANDTTLARLIENADYRRRLVDALDDEPHA